MNTKRQTIWLVSMLSIMVVLSAYYLFTEPAATPNKVAQNQTQQGNKTKTNATEASTAGNPGGLTEVKVNEVKDPNLDAQNVDKTTDKGTVVAPDITTEQGEGKTTDKTTVTEKTTTDKAAKDKKTEPTAAATDQQIIDELSKQGATSKETIATYQQERNQAYTTQIDKLQGIVLDMSKTPEEAGKAQQELTALDEKEQKITNLEDELRKQFGDAVIKQQDKDKYQVVVASDQLEVSEAVSIVDLIVKELKVSQDKVSVKRIAP
ncbi:hypothetical protein BVG16_03215 [Paenibacillus selenitireducens]|uniref:Mutants block sporulation after engulfment (Stage III sporulation) n=1 Tax=Paenibacillus selenitireducens TaxID=1324314 RepID=A0A1T2XNF1_9BACL|nr:SpoIIIAH-like family protein [Paenibacillus selenitireducens]OPA81338.1 hypothetical protein BVG16_03215 [Paenibacillus selenitireducens]